MNRGFVYLVGETFRTYVLVSESDPMFRLFAPAVPPDDGLLADPVGLNVFVLPADLAYPFIAYCYANYASGSVVDFSDRGSPLLLTDTPTPTDVRTAASAYDVMRGGERLRTTPALTDEWADDLVAVGIGCSVIVDHALIAWGIRPKHIEQSAALAVYETAIETRAVGPFRARQHVSMRIVKKSEAERASAVTARFPALHGAPVHIGDPAGLGIDDLQRPVLGAGLTPEDDEVCLFWGCGVTLRAALSAGAKTWLANAEGHLVQTGLLISALQAGGK